VLAVIMEWHNVLHLIVKPNMRLARHLILFSLFYSSQVLSQNQLNYGKVLADRYFQCDTNQFKKELYSYYKYSIELKTICESKNDLEIRYYTTWGVTPGWKLYIIGYNKGHWSAYEYWYNFGRKTFDTLHPVKISSLTPNHGFDSLFKKLKQNNIFTLPDEGTIDFELDYTDPAYNLITYKVHNKFRSYRILFPSNYKEKYPNIKSFEYYDKLLDIFLNQIK
jgi:hypothetical protein